MDLETLELILAYFIFHEDSCCSLTFVKFEINSEKIAHNYAKLYNFPFCNFGWSTIACVILHVGILDRDDICTLISTLCNFCVNEILGSPIAFTMVIWSSKGQRLQSRCYKEFPLDNIFKS